MNRSFVSGRQLDNDLVLSFIDGHDASEKTEAGHDIDARSELGLHRSLLLLGLLVAAEHHEDKESKHDEQQYGHWIHREVPFFTYVLVHGNVPGRSCGHGTKPA